MTALILIVDDVPANIKLLEAKLANEYYDVITAKDGFEAIQQTKEHKPDLILLDVMMPGMDGFETCRKLKEDSDVSHIPVVMVTALSEPSDRVNGLEAGADDFITKPINDTALFARVKSLVRIKVLTDELRLRGQTGSQMGVNDVNTFAADVSGSNIVLIDDDEPQSKRIIERLSESFNVTLIDKPTDSKEDVPQGDFDLFIISTQLFDVDGLRVASHIKSHEIHRNIPCLMLIDEDDSDLMLKGLDMGINDYIIMPIDPNEMVARVKTQIRRKKFQDALKSNYQESMSMAITDSLTGLYNRHYLDAHIQNLVKQSFQNKKPFSMIIMDMDHFKSVNDNYGHNVGDEVLKQLANIIINTIRSTDLAARFGGEEFVVLMPETRAPDANDVAERIRSIVENTPFKVSHEIGTLNKTISLGVSYLNEEGDTTEELLKRSDAALYLAKDSGRNQFKTQEDI